MILRKILVPTDFSESADHALPHAVELCGRFDAELIALHVRTLFTDDPNNPEHHFLNVQEYESYLRKEIDKTTRHLDTSLSLHTELTRSVSPASGILDYIAEHEIDLTVMGTHGRSALTHLFLGSVAEKVVRHAPCPVLTVGPERDGYRQNPSYQKILVAFDFSEHARLAARNALEIARRFDARVHVLYVLEQEVHPAFFEIWKQTVQKDLPEIARSARESLEKAVGTADVRQLDVHVKTGDGKAHSEIVRFAQAEEIDLIVMGTHGLSGAEHMLLGSTTERVVRIAPCPVLTFKKQ